MPTVLPVVDYTNLLPHLSDSALVWLYVADRLLSDAEIASLREDVEGFQQQWASHGRAVRGGFDILYGRIAVVGGSLEAENVSGCGIDTSVRAVRDAAERRGIGWAAALTVTYRDSEGLVQNCSRSEMRRQIEAEAIGPDTPVFDLSIATLGEIRAGGLERALSQSWFAPVANMPTGN